MAVREDNYHPEEQTFSRKGSFLRSHLRRKNSRGSGVLGSTRDCDSQVSISQGLPYQGLPVQVSEDEPYSTESFGGVKVLTQSVLSGVQRKEQLFLKLKASVPFLVRRSRVLVSKQGHDLVMVWGSTEEANFLLVLTLDSWVQSGAHECKVLSSELLSRLDVVRLYENTNTSFWKKIELSIEEGLISVGTTALA